MLHTQFRESHSSQFPMVELLCKMGYEYLGQNTINQMRNGDISRVLLHDVLIDQLVELNTYEHDGETHRHSKTAMRNIVTELENRPVEGILSSSEEIYQDIMPHLGGRTVQVEHGGVQESKNIRFFDFDNIENNVFHITAEYEVQGKQHDIRPDIVLFINGIPMVVVENKKMGVHVAEAINQHLRNQQNDYCQKLYTFANMLVAANGSELVYGTTRTPAKFFAHWREKDGEERLQARTVGLMGTPLDDSLYNSLQYEINHTIGDAGDQETDRMPNAQDYATVALLDPARVLDIVVHFVVFQGTSKIMARYQQYFGIKKMLERIDADTPRVDEREGGLVWHTQGSGKSLTMAMFIKNLIESKVDRPRVLVVTHRRDLDKQIKETLERSGLKKDVVQAKTGRDLLDKIRSKTLAVVTTLVDKFDTVSSSKDFVDPDANIFVLVDEAHTGQGGIKNIAMRKTIPHACYIAFTGTPLLSNDKSRNQFGEFIDTYTIDDALQDNIILPLIYEARYSELSADSEAISRHIKRMKGLGEDEQKKLESEVSKQGMGKLPSLILEQVSDMQDHYVSQFQGTGLKGQVVMPSKFAAVMAHNFFKNYGQVQTAVVMSDENGIIDTEDDDKKEVLAFINDIKSDYGSIKKYEESVVNDFKTNDKGVELLIVVDKLLTGFDAPRNTVLYLAKQLREHNLLQAIARVNRLYDNEPPKSAGYVIDYSENGKNIKEAMELFSQYDSEDVHNALIDYTEKIRELEIVRSSLVRMFGRDVFDTGVEQALSSISGDSEQALEQRDTFYGLLREFIKTFDECLTTKGFVENFEDLDRYREELKYFIELRSASSVRNADSFDISQYKQRLQQILKQHITAGEVERLCAPFELDPAVMGDKLEQVGSDRAKAEAVAQHLDKKVEEQIMLDPAFYEQIRTKVQEIILEMRTGKIEDAAALEQLKEINHQEQNKQDSETPQELLDQPRAALLYRNFREKIPQDIDVVDLATGVIDVAQSAMVVDWHRNNEILKQITWAVDDYLYDHYRNQGIDSKKSGDLATEMVRLLRDNHSV